MEAPRKAYDDHYKVNILSTIALTKILYHYLLKNKTRKVIFISSAASRITDFAPSFPVHGQTKTAINYTAKAVSFELGPEEFTVVPIHPGIMSTEMIQSAIESYRTYR